MKQISSGFFEKRINPLINIFLLLVAIFLVSSCFFDLEILLPAIAICIACLARFHQQYRLGPHVVDKVWDDGVSLWAENNQSRYQIRFNTILTIQRYVYPPRIRIISSYNDGDRVYERITDFIPPRSLFNSPTRLTLQLRNRARLAREAKPAIMVEPEE